MNQSALIIMP